MRVVNGFETDFIPTVADPTFECERADGGTVRADGAARGPTTGQSDDGPSTFYQAETTDTPRTEGES